MNASGATAIGCFQRVWKPSYHRFGVPDEGRRTLRSVAGSFRDTFEPPAVHLYRIGRGK